MAITETRWFLVYRKIVLAISGWLEWIGIVGLSGMVIVALVDVVGSKWFHWPLPGSTEMAGVLQVVAVAGGMAYSKIDGRHIRVDFLVQALKPRARAAFEILISILVLGFFAIASVMAFKYALSILGSGTKTLLVGINLSPFAFFISLFCFVMCLVMIMELLSFIDKVRK
jgi:TRAP-type C4-dicarboxylate transport system permease small subunit